MTAADKAAELTILTATRALIAQGWTQTYYAVDVDNNAVSSLSDNAVRWCLAGGLTRAVFDNSAAEASTADRHAADEAIVRLLPDNMNAITWNDAPKRTQAEVLALLDQAIASETS